jgi:hypothetical protein
MKPQDLGDSLVMRNACKEEIPALLEHFRAVHSENVIDELRAMLELYPRFSWEDSFIIVKPESREMISCIILLQNAWVLGGIEFSSVEMEAVGTLEPYRYRGHMHILNDAFEKRVAKLQPVIQAIAGIPNFYRNFGYEYAATLGGGYPVTPGFVPSLAEGQLEPVTFEEVDDTRFKEFLRYREAHLSDRTLSRTWYRSMHPEDAAYLLFEPASDQQEAFFFYLLKEHKKTVGAFYLSRWENRIDVVELYLDSHSYVDAVLRFAITKAQEWGGLPVRVVPPNQAQIREYVQARSAMKAINRYAWYIKIPSIPRFVETLKPLLSDRLKNTEFQRYTGELKITDYKEGYTLTFNQGEFKGISKNEDRDPGKYNLRMPRGALTRLLMGYETFDALAGHEPDVMCSATMQPLVRILFPQLEANVDPYY